MNEAVAFWARYTFKAFEVLFKVIGWQLVISVLIYYSIVLGLPYFSYFTNILYLIYMCGVALFVSYILLATRTMLGLRQDVMGLIVCSAIKGAAFVFQIFIITHPSENYVEALVRMQMHGK